LIQPFFKAQTWTIAAKGHSHVIDTLARKIEPLLIMKSDLNILTWLQEWKHTIVDQVANSSFQI